MILYMNKEINKELLDKSRKGKPTEGGSEEPERNDGKLSQQPGIKLGQLKA